MSYQANLASPHTCAAMLVSSLHGTVLGNTAESLVTFYLFISLYLFIKTSFAWVTKLSVSKVFQFGPGVKHNTSK